MGKKEGNILNYFIKIIFQIICKNNIFNLRGKKCPLLKGNSKKLARVYGLEKAGLGLRVLCLEH
jgi:hypothetical protein